MAMEGVVAEFSNLNALQGKGAWSSPVMTPREGQSREALQEPSGQKERLLRGETSYTGGATDAKSNEQFIEDQPVHNAAQLASANLLPRASTAEERERLLRRLEMCAKAREESTKIMSIRFAQRDAVKSDNRKERQTYMDKMSTSQRDRDERWSRKLQRSPFAVDLVAENQRIDEENRVKDHIEQRRQRMLAKRNREAHNSIFKRATAETDELDQLRAEKRMLLENERMLKALRDVEKSNARTALILQERRRVRMQKQGEGVMQGQIMSARGDRPASSQANDREAPRSARVPPRSS
eukprot:TRINITY_DN20853_c0_g1_i1.p1 TRINITY_DN20853_c0_g1~~TRINITY_DN20853_c0_g1_i1.p1  ORF type:complete len:296 (+),score=73.94 TRINITY_DN20853_c0_g1_i1:107-994(+)